MTSNIENVISQQPPNIRLTLQGKPTKPGEVRHFKFTQIVKNGSIYWSSLLE